MRLQIKKRICLRQAEVNPESWTTNWRVHFYYEINV